MIRALTRHGRLAFATVCLLGGSALPGHAAGGMEMDGTTPHATAILAGGCFWCLQHDLEHVPGVVDVVSGYAGGDRPNPTYETYHDLDATYKIPHIEVVQVTYDPARLSYSALLATYLRKIDPTDNRGQFCDRGASYRPAIFAASQDERTAAEEALRMTEDIIRQPVRVDILGTSRFWPAEEYHQHYATKNPTRYKFYRWNCGRDQRVKEIWGNS